jgi:hypothetical protein
MVRIPQFLATAIAAVITAGVGSRDHTATIKTITTKTIP